MAQSASAKPSAIDLAAQEAIADLKSRIQTGQAGGGAGIAGMAGLASSSPLEISYGKF